jgi:hypothetical protein
VKKLIYASAVFAAITVAPFAANAAPKSGCPATPARWEHLTVTEAVQRLNDGGVLVTEAEIDQRFNRNGDDEVCLATRWEDLNPKSKWSGFTLYIVADNNANATK